MKRIIVFCEGQTEEAFVRDVLSDYFTKQNLFLTPIIFLTSKTHNSVYRGGITSYKKAREQIIQKSKEDSNSFVTTLVDYYGLPDDWVGLDLASNQPSVYEKIKVIEEAWKKDISCSNFIPNLLLHEFEALLFSDADKFNDWFDEQKVSQLITSVSSFETPEHINNSKVTAPSKRILEYFGEYQKPTHGSLIAQEIGLDVIREKCVHFNSWVENLLSL